MRKRTCIIFILLIVFSDVPCKLQAQLPTGPSAVFQEAADHSPTAQAQISPSGDGHEILYEAALVSQFYDNRSQQPIWTNADGATPSAAALLKTLREVGEEGLLPSDYHLDRLEQLYARLQKFRSSAWPNLVTRARFEVLMTDAFFFCGRHLAIGRPRALQGGESLADTYPDTILLNCLETALVTQRIQETLFGLAPRHGFFQRLRTALSHYRKIVASGGWPAIPSGPILRRGDHGPQVILLRQRLAAEGDLKEEGVLVTDRFDTQLETAVKRFQRRYGLNNTGVVDPHTLQAMNIPAEDRMSQIALNLERWRWLYGDLNSDYILVNISDFALWAMNGDTPTFTLRVVVGQTKPEWQTPAFSSRMTQVIFHPYWVVPKSIATREILPKIKANPDYLKKERLQVVRRLRDEKGLDPYKIEWEKLSEDNFPYTLRQDPGPGNALGNIKFFLTNTPDIYLHDTPSQRYFGRTVRTFSHGCVRVEKPMILVRHLLGNKPGTERMIKAALQKKVPTPIALPKPVPTYLVYATAWADPDGGVNFRPDIYHRDGALEVILKEPRHPFPLSDESPGGEI